MPRKPILAYAAGGTAAAIAAIVITASTVGLTPSTSGGARDTAAAPAFAPGVAAQAVVTAYEGDSRAGNAVRFTDERHPSGEHEDDDDD